MQLLSYVLPSEPQIGSMPAGQVISQSFCDRFKLRFYINLLERNTQDGLIPYHMVHKFQEPCLNVPSQGPSEIIETACLDRQLNTSISQLLEKVLPFDPQTGS